MAWHAAYDDPGSSLRARLKLVEQHVAAALDRAPAGPIRLVSLCAGQGRDVIETLAGHPRRDDVSAVLVEADPANVAWARDAATVAGLPRVEVREADASQVASFADALPADVLLLCGIFGNVSAADIERTITAAPALCAPGATVIWTRHRREPDLTPQIRGVVHRGRVRGAGVRVAGVGAADGGGRGRAAGRGRRRAAAGAALPVPGRVSAAPPYEPVAKSYTEYPE